jgi:DNA-binding SARP family transcriptional activator
VTFEIHLLGSPRVVRDGTAMQAPRGHKVWGLLAYLLLRESAPSRGHVADLLFPAAEDPMAALRWALTMMRRSVGDAGAFRGDPLVGTWAEVPVVDVLALRTADPGDVAAFGRLGQDLLSSMSFPGCPSFELWLESERRHARGTVESLLHEAALGCLAQGDADAAADLAGQLASLNPYDENFQVLLVRCLAVGGRGVEAARQASACRELFRTELGVVPSPALDAAMLTMTTAPTATLVSGRGAVLALLEAGEAAIGAGALEAGLHCLRRSVTDAAALADGALRARTFAALGTALVHAARGSDEEGAAALHQALACPDLEPATRAHAWCELAYVEFLHGRYDRVEVSLGKADLVTAGSAQRATALSVRGSTLSDVGRYPAALAVLDEALTLAQDDRRRSYVLSMIGRVHLLRGDRNPAVRLLDEALALATATGWVTFIPWPEALRAEIDLHDGDLRAARARLEHAFALGCQIGDPCWEGISARGLGLVHAAAGDLDLAVSTLSDARRRAARLPDSYLWVQGHILDALAAVAVTHLLPQASGWVDDLARLSEHSGMAELTVRAAIHRWHNGEPAARQAARALAADVDNPALAALVD